MNYSSKDWYLNAHNKFMGYTNDSVFIGLICATSPRKSLKANLNLSKKLYYNYLMGINIFKDVKGLMNAHKNNVLRAIKGETLQGENDIKGRMSLKISRSRK